MSECPFCQEELKKKEGDDWICGGCGEVVPAEHVKTHNPQCFDTFNKGR
jgi:ribosomal protein L37AE/L43A